MGYIPQDKNKVYYILCQHCSHFHPWFWDGDCTNDSNRFTYEQLDERHGSNGWDTSPCTGLVWVEDELYAAAELYAQHEANSYLEAA